MLQKDLQLLRLILNTKKLGNWPCRLILQVKYAPCIIYDTAKPRFCFQITKFIALHSVEKTKIHSHLKKNISRKTEPTIFKLNLLPITMISLLMSNWAKKCSQIFFREMTLVIELHICGFCRVPGHSVEITEIYSHSFTKISWKQRFTKLHKNRFHEIFFEWEWISHISTV